MPRTRGADFSVSVQLMVFGLLTNSVEIKKENIFVSVYLTTATLLQRNYHKRPLKEYRGK